MSRSCQILFLAIAAVLAMACALWAEAGRFALDLPAYGRIALLALALTGAGLFYDRIRRDGALSAMLLATAFLIVIAAAISALNYMLLTVTGPRIDGALAAADRMLGVDWPAMMTWAAQHPAINTVLRLAYISSLPQLALLIVTAGFQGQVGVITRLSLAVTIGALLSVAIWTVAPSFGAFSVYSLPADVTAHLSVALDSGYARELEQALAQGPGLISPDHAKGLIGFPSYHTVLALLTIWYARKLKGLRLLLPGVNMVVLVALPIQGGHHVVDIAAGALVAAAAILAANALAKRREKSPAAAAWDRAANPAAQPAG